jgi:hypothetical protein
VSTVDPIEAALGGQEPDPNADDGSGNPEGAGIDHPVLTRFGGDVQKALDAYQELDRSFGQEGHRLGQTVAQLQDQIAALQSQSQPGEPDPQYGQPQMPDMSIDDMRRWFDENPADATAYLVTQGQMMLLDQIKADMDERLKPLEVNVGRTTATSLVDGLKSDLGNEVVSRNVDALVALQKDDPDLYKGDPQIVFKRMRMAVLAADAEKGNQRGASNGAAASKDVAVMGGSQGRNPQANDGELDPAEEFKNELISTGTADRDIFGNPKRR